MIYIYIYIYGGFIFACIYLCLKASMYEYSYFDYLVSHVLI